MVQHSYMENGPVEIVDLPINSMVIVQYMKHLWANYGH